MTDNAANNPLQEEPASNDDAAIPAPHSAIYSIEMHEREID